MPGSHDGKRLSFRVYFPQAGSCLIVRNRNGRSTGSAKQPVSTLAPSGKVLYNFPSGAWRSERTELNCITLDSCRYRAGGGRAWKESSYVLHIQELLEKKMKKQDFSLLFDFRTDLSRKPGSFFLVMEKPWQFRIAVNGKRLPNKDLGSWIDSAFRKIDISGYINLKGGNTIQLSGRFIYPTKPNTVNYLKNGTELESVYLAGDFRLKGSFAAKEGGYYADNFILSDETMKINNGNAVLSGYPFYAGSFIFTRAFDWKRGPAGKKHLFLEFQGLNALSAEVTLNNRKAGVIFCHPRRIEITGLLKKGSNTLKIEITNSLRNLLGPHHNGKVVESGHCGPFAFADRKDWLNQFKVVSFGLGKLRIVEQ